MERNEKILTQAPYSQLLLRLCLPSVIIMLVMVAYNMADTFFIGQMGDPAMLAAVSLCAPLFSILTGLGTLFGSGGCTAISLALGRKDSSRVKAITSLCFVGGIVLGVLFLCLVEVLTGPLCTLLGADADTLAYTRQYMRIVALGAPFALTSTVFCNLVRADGAAVVSMVCNLAGTVANIILDGVFVLVFRWGVAGVAVATVLGNLLSACSVIIYVLRKKPDYSLSPRDIRLRREIVAPVFTLGLPLACSTLMMSFSNMLSNRLMMQYGEVALAAQGVAGKIGMLVMMLIMGISMGMQPAISYCFGAGNLRRLGQIIRDTLVFNIGLGAVLGVLGFLVKDSLIAIFLDDAEVIAYGRVMVLASLAIGPIYAVHQVSQTYLQSIGQAKKATVCALLDKGILLIPILYVLNRLFGAYGIAFASAVTLCFCAPISTGMSLHQARQQKKIEGHVSAAA